MFHIRISRSAFVTGIGTQTCRYVTQRGDLYVKDTRRRVLQTICFCLHFCNTGRDPLDNVMDHPGTIQHGQYTGLDKTNELWLGRELCFLKVVSKAPLLTGEMRCTYHKRISCSICGIKKMRQFVSFQLYKVIGVDALDIENICDTMECIRLSWENHGEKKGTLYLQKYFNCAPYFRYVIGYMLSMAMKWWTSSTRRYRIRHVYQKR